MNHSIPRRLGALLLWCAACSHPSPPGPGDYTPGGPNGSGSPLQLTYNLGVDLTPGWYPDGHAFLYSEERVDRPDRDRCLAQQPAAGGSITREICDRVPAADDSVDSYTWPAIQRDGRVAYVRATAWLGAGWPISPRFHELVLAPLAAPFDTRVLLTIPYIGPSGRGHDEATHIRWLGDSALIYVGEAVHYIPPCRGCAPDTVSSGQELVRLDFRSPVPVLTMLPASDQASSVDVVGNDSVYFTVNGDTKVYRLILSTDSVAVVHDFGGIGIARDVQVRGHRLFAIVGGAVSFVVDSVYGPLQRDFGGSLVAVDLSTDAETLMSALPLRHVAVAPDGAHAVAELVSGKTSDLYLVDLP